MKVCKKCGATNLDDAQFCVQCGGNELSVVGGVANPSVPVQSVPPAMPVRPAYGYVAMPESRSVKVCAKCGNPCAREDAFCTNCGSNDLRTVEPPVPKAVPVKKVKVCKNCGKASENAERFCTFCGSNDLLDVEGVQMASKPAPTVAPPAYPASAGQEKNGKTIAGFVLSVIAMFFMLMPPGGWALAWILGAVGLPFSIIGLVKSIKTKSSKGLALAGTIMNGIALILPFLLDTIFYI